MPSVFLFEMRYRLRQPSTYVYFLLMFLLAFGFIASDVVKVGGGEGQVKLNAPLVLGRLILVLTMFGTLISSALVGTAVLRDFEMRSHELFFTTRLTKWQYLGGRFLGSFAVALLVFSGILGGLWVGSLMPWLDAAKLLPYRAASYGEPFLLFVVPDLLLLCAVFFVLGALTRNLMAVYTSGIAVLVAYVLAQSLTRSLDSHLLSALLDPFGITPLTLATQYWTPAERNTLLLPVTGYLLWNRLLWSAVGVGVLAAGGAAFRFSAPPPALRRARAETRGTPAAPARSAPPARPAPSPGGAALWAQFWSLVGFQYRGMVRSVAFVLIALMSVGTFFIVAGSADEAYGTPIYPVTRVMADTIGTAFPLFFLILLTVYAGELVWKERALKADQLYDALPTPTALTYAGKLTALLLAQALLLAVLIVAGVCLQAAKGYTHFQIGLYFAYLFGAVFPTYALFTALAFLIHAAVNNKFLGHAAVVLSYLMASVILPQLGLEHNLALYGGMPTVTYSDMNGFGPYARPLSWFTLYWTACAVGLGVATALLWVRGTEAGWAQRRRAAAARWGRGARATAAAAALAFVGSGAFIFYNTNVLNDYVTAKGRRHMQARYEREYRRYAGLPQPRITGVTLHTDLYPRRLQYAVRGAYTLKNETGAPIPDVHIALGRDMTVRAMAFAAGATRTLADPALGYSIYHLARPLAPGATTTLAFDVAYLKRGFPSDDPETHIARNGTFLGVEQGAFPAIGYQKDGELTDGDDRKKEGLGPRARMAPAGDAVARRDTYLSSDSDWVRYDATVSTDPDQIALSPGYLQREWTQGGRRYFHYRMDTPILNFYSFLSARYAVRRDRWGGVAIEVYYDPAHPYNVARMIAAVKASLAYYTKSFGPYQFRQLRIVEFPAYASFAQSFPNTIPFSEGVGFIARVKSDRGIDYPYLVTAHEVAHQWWGHQVVGADVQGSEMLSESLAQYSAMMVMEHTYGKDRMRQFLRASLDSYLKGRGAEREAEEPLVRTEDQPYIHYDKGALAFYALRDYIGEARLNAVLARFVRDNKFQGPPYPAAEELVAALRRATPPALRYVLTDLFETITLYDDKATAAACTQTGPDTYRVRLTVDARKLRADGAGRETPIPIHDWVDVGVFGAAQDGQALGRPLFLEKRLITRRLTTFTLTVRGEPLKAGIDPYNRLIDRAPDDNVVAVRSGD